MAADCSILRSPTAFTTVCAPYCSVDGIRLPPPPLANGFHDDLRPVLLSGWHLIAHTSASQRLSRWFARRIAQRMAVHYSYLSSSTAFPTVCAPYCSADGSALLILPLDNGFPDGFRAVLLSGRQRIARSSARQRLSRPFIRRIAQQMAAHYSYLRSSMAFSMVCALYCTADGSRLLILRLVNGFKDGLGAVLRNGWQRIAHTSARQWLSRRFARRIALQLAAYCSFFHSPTAFTTVCMPYCSADGIGLLNLPLANCFHDDLRTADCSPYRSFFRSSTLIIPGQFADRIPQQMAADYSFFRSSTAFTMFCAPYCSADGSGLLIPPLINSFPVGLRAVLLSGWHRIAHTSASQRLSRWFARRIAQRMVAHYSYLPSSTAFLTVCVPYCSADGSALLILPLVNSFPDGSRTISRSGWQCISHTSARQRLSRRFVRRIAQRTAAHCSFFRSSTAFTTVRAPYCSAVGSALLIPPLINSFSDSSGAVLLSRWLQVAHTSACQWL